MQELRLDHSTDAATRVALTRNDIAHQSVQALLDDLAHVTTHIPVVDRAAAARAVLEHHRPAVNESLLSEEGRRLQTDARAALQQLAESDRHHDDDPTTAPPPGVFELRRGASTLERAPIDRAPVDRAGGEQVQTFDDFLLVPSTPATLTTRTSGGKLRQLGITLGLSGAIATGGFTIGALLQRLL